MANAECGSASPSFPLHDVSQAQFHVGVLIAHLDDTVSHKFNEDLWPELVQRFIFNINKSCIFNQSLDVHLAKCLSFLELLGGSVSVGVVQDGTANALASKLDVLAVVHCQPGFLPLPLQYENQLLLFDFSK